MICSFCVVPIQPAEEMQFADRNHISRPPAVPTSATGLGTAGDVCGEAAGAREYPICVKY